MKDLIKKVLREYVELNELMKTHHYDKRLKERFRSNISFPIIMATPIKGDLEREIVGEYHLSEKDRNQIVSNIELVESVDLPTDGEYGIMIYSFSVDPRMLTYNNVDEKLYVMRKVVAGNSSLYIRDRETKSMGDTLFAIVENQSIKTILYARSYGIQKTYGHFEDILSMDDIWKLKMG